MVQVSASLLAADYARLGEAVQRADKAGADAFHFDLMDGHYVPNLALSPDHLVALRPYTNLPFHVHLELGNPDQVLTSFNDFQADLILVQWDTLVKPEHTFGLIRERGASVGLSLNPDDPLTDITSVLERVDALLLLGVHPGFGGQKMFAGMLARITTARALIDRAHPGLPIFIDGGVNPQNARALVNAGADWLVVGTALYRSARMTATVRELKGLSPA